MPTSTQSPETLAAHPWLADPCPCPEDRYNGIICDLCQATGKRHSWAWERCGGCPACHGMSPVMIDAFKGTNCDGSGWVLDVTLEKVWAEFAKLGGHQGPFLVRLMEQMPDKYSIYDPYSGLEWWGNLTEAERRAAALDALRQVRG